MGSVFHDDDRTSRDKYANGNKSLRSLNSCRDEPAAADGGNWGLSEAGFCDDDHQGLAIVPGDRTK